VTAVEELGAVGPLAASGEGPPATGGALGGSAATELLRFGRLAFGPEEPQPAASATARSSPAAVTLAAQFRLRDPDIRRLWAKSERQPLVIRRNRKSSRGRHVGLDHPGARYRVKAGLAPGHGRPASMPPCLLMEDRAAELRARRAARIKALRRRRHAVTLAALVAVLGLAVMLAIVVSRRSVGRTAVRAAPPSAAVALRPAVARGWRWEAQLRAVERLAAYGLPLFCGGRSKRMVALTFDDGPGPYTRLAIAKLRKHHLRATFFLVGKQIRAFPGLARLEKPVGAVGDHTLAHPFLPALPRAKMVQQIAGAKALIEHVAAQPVVLFRPPYEGRTPAIEHEVRALGMLEVLWNVDSGDSLGANYGGIERDVLAGLHPGSIILMHENRGQTIRALLTIFAALARDHLRAVTVPELVTEDPPSLAQLRAGGHGCGVRLQAGNGA
jgi:peptidoglycan-N-acetylglucosamine deacetylase